jgi:predicted transcriptional regulator
MEVKMARYRSKLKGFIADEWDSHTQFSKESDIPRTKLSEIISGYRIPNVQDAVKISLTLKKSLSDIFHKEDYLVRELIDEIYLYINSDRCDPEFRVKAEKVLSLSK